VLDAKGKIAWGRADIGGDPIVVVLTEQVSDAHLAGLRKDGVSYIFAGRRELDLALALEILNRELGIKRLEVNGGGITNGAFLPSIWATIRIVGGSMILSLLLGLLLAVLLDRKFRGQALARTLLITPFLVMPAAAALIWKYSLLEVNTGMVNWGLGLLGIEPVAWNTDHPALTIVFTLTWQYTPFMMLILLAGLQSQAGEILEAADVDGASVLQTFRFMTLPHLRTYAELAILLGTVFMIQVFDPVNIMTKGAGNTKTIAYLLYERAFIGQQIGEAAAYGVITVIVTIVIATIALRTMFKIFTEEAR